MSTNNISLAISNKTSDREFSSPISDQSNEELCFVDNFGSYKILKKSIKVPPAILSINYHIMIYQ